MTRVHPSVKKRYSVSFHQCARSTRRHTQSTLDVLDTAFVPRGRRRQTRPRGGAAGLYRTIPTGTAVVRTQTGTLSCDANTNPHC